LIKIEPLDDEENKFLEYLNYQISKMYGFYNKIPTFKQNNEVFNYELGLKESQLILQNNSEGRRSENSYTIMRKELESLIQKYKNRQQSKSNI
jgi:hypothetical protein